jgi:hypothetical protein
MKKRFLRFLLLSGTLLTMLTACEYDFIEPTPPVAPPPTDDTISFAQDVQPFFNAKCVNCHKGSIAPDLTTGKSYTALVSGNYIVTGNPATSELYIVCKPGGSMASYTTTEELDLLYRWIYAGAKND